MKTKPCETCGGLYRTHLCIECEDQISGKQCVKGDGLCKKCI